jgi:integrase/recombinase XerC
MTSHQRPLPFVPESNKWMEELKASGKSDLTVECYSRDLRDVAQAIGGSRTSDLLLLDQAAIDAMALTWSDEGTGPATASRRFSALRGFGSHLVREDGLDLSRLLSARFPSAQKGKRPAVAESEINCLLSDDQQDSWRGLRDTALFAIQSSSGLTTAEAITLDVGDVDLDSRIVVVRETHLAQRVAGLSEQSEFLIRQYLAALPFPLERADPLFVTSLRKRLNVRTVQLSFRRRRLRLGISENASMMGLRHALGAKLAEDGSPALLASALGVCRTTVTRYFDGMN